MSFAISLRGSFAGAKLAVQQQLEYRFNLFADAVVQPVCVAVIEVALWWTICQSFPGDRIAGYSKESYLAYALWSAFFARIYANWVYESKMTNAVYSGDVNTTLVRPVTFYSFYLGQMLGYKALTTVITLSIPVVISIFAWPSLDLTRLPLALALVSLYLLMVHTIAFVMSAFAFFYHRVFALCVAKNFALWVLSGEMFPLDLAGEPLRTILIRLPFASGVYVPIGYLTGRLGPEAVGEAFISVACGLAVTGAVGAALWTAGLKRYAGTGA